MNKLLVLSCSQSKRREYASLPAIQRYDGPAFRLLRRYLKNSTVELGIYILSAEFGLIQHTRRIPFYDQRMTKQRVDELKGKVVGQARRFLSAESHSQRHRRQLFINLGRDYLHAFEPVFSFLPSGSNITIASGASGKRLAEMYDWLYGKRSELHNLMSIKPNLCSTKLRGFEIKLTKDQILNIARSALKKDGHNAKSYQSWYVQIDDARVSSKWLVSLLTGLPVSDFHSDEARRVLSQLGIEVIRV